MGELMDCYFFIDEVLSANLGSFINEEHHDRSPFDKLFIMKVSMNSETPIVPWSMTNLSVLQIVYFHL